MNASLNSRSTAAPLRPAAAVAICLLWSCGGSGGGTPPDGGMPAEPAFPTFAAGLRANAIGEAIARSGREGRWIEL